MIFGHGGCKYQRFGPEGADLMSLPDCSKFLVISPNQYKRAPDWLWMDTGGEYESIQSLEIEAASRMRKIEKLKTDLN